MMREWRVGTISMGASLILLGVLLFVSQLKEIDLLQIFFSWWPFLLIVLGVEIVLYIVLSKQKTVAIKYDFLSIMFIGVLGTVTLAFMFLTFSGIIHEVRHVVHAKEETYDYPPYIESISSNIERIVLDIGNEAVRIEGTDRNVVQVFGTYRTTISDLRSQIKTSEDYLSVIESHDTLFIKVKSLPEKQGFFHEIVDAELVVLLPTDVNLEYKRHHYGKTTIRPGLLKADWFINDPSEIILPLHKESDIEVTIHDEKKQLRKTGEGTYNIHFAENVPEQLQIYEQ